MRWRINQLLQAKPEPAGTPEDFKHTVKNALSSLVRYANRQRQERQVTLGKNGEVILKPKTGEALWIVKKPGTPFFRHYNEVDNERDQFIQDFIDHPAVGENQEFLPIINEAVARVSFLLNYLQSKKLLSLYFIYLIFYTSNINLISNCFIFP